MANKAKQTANENPIEAAERILAELQAKQDRTVKAREADDRELGAVSYSALATGDRDATAKLEGVKERALRRDLEIKAIRSAIAQAQQNLADAKADEAMAEAAKAAEEVAEIAGIIREEGAKADKDLAQFIAAANNIKKCIVALQQRGVNSPNGAQLLALGRRAILGALVSSPFNKEFEHVAPRQQNFAQFTSSWAAAIENAVGAKTKKEVADERAA
jgi:hypothetical protein